MIRMEEGDAWIVEGALDPINFGMNQCGGLGPEARKLWVNWEDVRRSAYDPAARIEELDQDRVLLEILYPTPRISLALWWNAIDPEFHIACIRAYNDWLSEFCAHDTSRLRGIAMMPNVGADAAVEELQRATQLPGIVGAGLGRYPNGGLAPTPEDDRFWAAAQEARMPVNTHVTFATEPPGEHHRLRVSGEFRFLDAPQRAIQVIRAGIFDRYPDLDLVFAEVDCGWVPYVIERLDIMFDRNPARKTHAHTPKHYFDRNVFWVYITDHFGVASRHQVGVSQMMWSSDFPHAATDWPHSWDTINAAFEGADEGEKHAILAGNASRVYHLNNDG
jgi:predicted TIM-barrel fold metal-dependent hydrolase